DPVMALTTTWLGWALAAGLGGLAVGALIWAAFWRGELVSERRLTGALLRFIRARQQAKRSAGPPEPPPLPEPEPPLEVPQGVIMRRLTGVWKLPRYRMPDEK